MSIKVLALDLERTLISDAMNAEPRPGLYDFLSFCQERFERLALFTTLEEVDAREVMEELDQRGHLPPGFLVRLEYVDWCGESKDLTFIPGATPDEMLLVEDDGAWVLPEQRGRWIPIAAWDGGTDHELLRVRAVLEGWLDPGVATTPDQ